MEDKILNACGAFINPNLLKMAEELSGADAGVFVMRLEHQEEFERRGANYIRVSNDAPKPPLPAFTFQTNRDIPINEIHLETKQGRVKIVNVRNPETHPNHTYGDWDSAGYGKFPDVR